MFVKLGIGDGTVDIIISGTGVIKLDGDQQSEIQGLIDSGVIHGPDGVGYYMDSGYTYIVPEPMTFCLLGLGGLGLIRRRR
jgi:hypothetical protein